MELTTVRRTTTETDVTVSLVLTSAAPTQVVETTDGFLDHMIVTLAKYAGWDVAVRATGDLDHHLREDVALTLGRALLESTPPTCARYGTASVPMDDALVTAVVDVGGRPYWGGALPDVDYDHVLRSFVSEARATVHVVVTRGIDPHHVTEASFKAVGLALRQALTDGDTVFSTKGSVVWEVSE
jgi:imidazoleglycerol-phosphate dehydratase